MLCLLELSHSIFSDTWLPRFSVDVPAEYIHLRFELNLQLDIKTLKVDKSEWPSRGISTSFYTRDFPKWFEQSVQFFSHFFVIQLGRKTELDLNTLLQILYSLLMSE